MRSRRQTFLAWLIPCAIGLISCGLIPATAAAGGKPAIGTADGDALVPGFEWGVKTYGARCLGDGLSLTVDGVDGWKTAVGSGSASGGDLDTHLDLASGDGVRITFVRRDGEQVRTYIRCLPEDMPEFDFESFQGGGPRFFTVQMAPRYAVTLSRDGAPVWWLAAEHLPFDSKILPDGTVGWNGGGLDGFVDSGRWEVHSLTGRSIRTVSSSSGGVIDIHDYLELPNGNDLVGAPTYEFGVDTSAYGGSSSAAIRNTAMEELTPKGELVRRWNSEDHIGLDETPDYWWASLLGGAGVGYDVSHWNAVDVVGKFMYLSYRHLDAVYKVNRRTGRIVWKLGGTETPKSLEVLGDPRGDYPLSGQHDVNVLPDGTITIFDNAVGFGQLPRGVHYRIDERRGTARLIDQVKDPEVHRSGAGGSFRKTDDGWLVGWGVSGPGAVGAYDERGKPIFRLTYHVSASYRANLVPDQIAAADFRGAMNRMSR